MASWSVRRWTTAVVAGLAIVLVIGVPTDVVPNPVFGRPVPVTWWSYPVLALTGVLGGLLIATYVREPRPAGATGSDRADAGTDLDVDAPSRTGGIAGLLSFFAVGCPVCNKIVLVALGATGARRWFEPLQPLLAVASIVLLAIALRARLRSADACAWTPPAPTEKPTVTAGS
jgi:hypothetical protein